MRTYAKDLSAAYQEKQNDMQERRMRAAIIAVGSCRHTAWVNAGQPSLAQLSHTELSAADLLEFESLNNAWKQAAIKGREHE